MTTLLPTAEIPSIRSLFGSVMAHVLVGWLAMTAVSTLALAVWLPDLMWTSITIAGFSGLISVIALLPGMSLGDQPAVRSTTNSQLSKAMRTNRTGQFLVGCVAAMAIRVVGTVAIVAACRYQMGLPFERVLFFVGGWYIVLTAFEVILLVKNATTLDAFPRTSGVQPAGSSAPVDETDFWK